MSKSRSFSALKINGIIGFDDYLWKLPNTNNIQTKPKIAIELLKTFGAVMYGRQTSFQNRVRGNILRESRSSEGGIAKLARYTGKVSRTSSALAEKLFSEDFKGVNYDSN